jgi:hypothetical protein
MTLIDGLADLGSALRALQTASNIIKDWTSLRSEKERAAKLSEINAQILAAQTSAIQANAAQAALIKEVNSLEAKLAKFETWDAEKIRYELREVGRGAYVYVVKESMGSGEPSPWYCPTCYSNGKAMILQGSGKLSWCDLWKCYECSTIIQVPRPPRPNPQTNNPFGGPIGGQGWMR